VFRFDGRDWKLVGVIPEATQTYGFGIHKSDLYVSEWPMAHVFRYRGESDWVDTGILGYWDTGILGQELEAMPLLPTSANIPPCANTRPCNAALIQGGEDNSLEVRLLRGICDLYWSNTGCLAVRGFRA